MPPSILSRFKKSPSQPKVEIVDDSYTPSPNKSRRSVSPFTGLPNSDYIEESPTALRTRTTSTPSSHTQSGHGSGSHFVEEFDDQGNVTPDTRPRGFTLPALGTPKLTIQEDGASSPVSFGSSPLSQNRASHLDIRRKPSQERIGLGVGTLHESHEDEPLPRPRFPNRNGSRTGSSMSVPLDAASVVSAPVQINGRDRSGSTISNDLRPVKSGSAFGKTSSLKPPDAKKSKKSRRMSASSKNGIAAALAKGGLALAHGHAHHPDGEPILGHASNKSAPSSRRGSKRNPYLKSSHRPDGEGSDAALEFDDEDDDDDEDFDSEHESGLPVTGFAVASNRRNAEFHQMFPRIDEGDYLITDYGCALSKDILVQGRLYVSENHICFHANIFGWITDIVLPFSEIKTIEKRMTALVIPNAISISTPKKDYTFASFISRDTTFDVMMNIWRLCNPNAVMSSTSGDRTRSRAPSDAGADTALVSGGAGKGHAKTECACGKEGKHFTETALSTTFPSTPEKVYNLMFNSGWLKDFMSEDQKLKDIEQSDWKPSEETKNLTRGTSYIKPLNGSIGPKQTKCHIIDEQIHCDYDDYIVMLTTTKTPDVPSGGVFSVKTKTCLTWAGGSSTKVLVTTQVDWTGKSWVKGIIDKSAIEGQKQYHNDLDKGMRAHMKSHPTEFFPEGTSADLDEVEAENQKLSDAEKYAAQTRKNRQNQDYSALQGALDSVLSGIKAIFGGVWTAIRSISDLMNLGDEGSKVVILGLLVLVLVASNVYTYVAWRPSSESTILRRYKRSGQEGDYSEVLRSTMQDRGHGREGLTLREEGKELMRILDQVDQRSAALRNSIKSSVGGESCDGCEGLEFGTLINGRMVREGP